MANALKLESREYQQRIVGKTLHLLNTEADSVLIESPVGSGKTAMALMAAMPFAEKGWKIGWAAMRRNLLKQVKEEAVRIGYPFPITTISMFDKNAPPVDLLVVDEAQHDPTASMETVHSKAKPKKIIGLTATPQRRDRVNLCFQRTVNDASIGELIRMGYLSHYMHYTLPEYAPASVADFYVDHQEKWGKSLIFFRTLAECNQCVAQLKSRGLNDVELITGSSDRDTQLEQFADGRTRVVISMMVLAEGFDAPSLQTVFIRPSSRNPAIQMGGRVLRKYENLQFKNIVQDPSTHWPFTRTAQATYQYRWEANEWRSVDMNSNLATVVNNTRRILIRAAQQNVAHLERDAAVNDDPLY